MWSPRDTAPKDGTHFLAFTPGGGAWDASVWELWWDGKFVGDSYDCCYIAAKTFTHWMPLPDPPKV
jgi:hypothetical protein